MMRTPSLTACGAPMRNINREPVLRQLRDGRTLQGSRRIPSAVQINFGIRVDTVNDLL